jgi:hypothetical protein
VHAVFTHTKTVGIGRALTKLGHVEHHTNSKDDVEQGCGGKQTLYRSYTQAPTLGLREREIEMPLKLVLSKFD